MTKAALAALGTVGLMVGCSSSVTTERINPTAWSEGILDQAIVVSGGSRTVLIAGQVSLQDDADAPFGVVAKHPGDMAAQLGEALANIDALLAEAGMTRENIVHMRFFVTDMQAGLESFHVYVEWWGESDHRPPQSFIGINELFLPGLMVEVEATAVQ